MNVIKTPRLILRRFTENDLGDVYKIYGDEEINRFLPWFPPKNPEDARDFYINRIKSEYSKEGAYYCAVCLKEDNRAIGYVNISADDSHDLGYGLLKEFWHSGIITEACKALVEQLKNDGVPFVTATHDVNNPRSGEVMRRLGMKYQYSYQEQWQPKNVLVTFRLYQINLDGKDDRVYQKYWNNSDVHFIEVI